MRSFHVSFFVLLIVFVLNSKSDTLKFKSDLSNEEAEVLNRVKRIIGGQPISSGQWPWFVGLRGHVPTKFLGAFAVRYSDVYCGGAIIDAKWILTAAHCFFVSGVPRYGIMQTKNWYVKAGDERLTFNFGQKLCAIWNRLSGSQNLHCWYVTVDKIITHPEFSAQENWLNDIALVKLRESLPLSTDSTVSVVQLPSASDTSWPTAGTNCTMQGWGCTQPGETVSRTANVVSYPVVDSTQCSLSGGQTNIGDSRLCAGHHDSNIGLCKGDSGGPLICEGTDGVWRQAGIASFTSATSPGDVPGVFTRVSQYRTWIDQVINDNS